jgi:3-dehydroquinate dehydratase / shikimate dehydrogenase
MTRLAVSIMVRSAGQALATAAQAAERGADLVELRIDAFARNVDDADAVAKIVGQCALPCIVTCRPTWEGGQHHGTDAVRLDLLGRVVEGGRPPAYIDFELAACQRDPNVVPRLAAMRGRHTRLILSSHDFDRRPADLLQRVEAMAGMEICDVIKVAWQARSLRDNIEAFELLSCQLKPTIALCMGPFGQPSRILAGRFGGMLTFAAIDADSATAPGQPTVQELKSLYRWDAVGRSTRVYGVIGYPLGHSMSPAIHNAGFGAIGYDGVYLPLAIPPEYEHFKATVGALLDAPALNFRGASVTIPHKENLLRFVAERGGDGGGRIEPLTARIGAANTLTVRDDGSLYASNTDCAGALGAVCDSLSIEPRELKGQRVAVIGAGGAARAIVAGFAQQGAAVMVYNRTFERAAALAADFNDMPGKVAAHRFEDLPRAACQVVINCTPIGMHPEANASPLPNLRALPHWGPGTIVFDTIYNPVSTKLLRDARAAGCLTIPGTEMFVRQAAAQFTLWTGEEAPIDVFRRVLLEHLGA